MPPPRVYITGSMGSGKSTAGPLVAEQLGYRFLDLDAEVERAAGATISELFVRRGERTFRALETAVLSEAAAQERVVVATGGGALANEGNLLMAETSGFIVYLKLSPAVLAGRLHGPNGRPLLHDEEGHPMTEEQIVTRLGELIDQRERFYQHADVVIEAEGMTPPEVAAAIVESLPVVAA
ncbi:MAG: shikimate kinase [Rhodothermales bacterium]